jgi:hypothetical protein
VATAAERIITALNVFILVIWLCPFCRVSADALEADLGSQSADTIKLNVIQCGSAARLAKMSALGKPQAGARSMMTNYY